VSAAAASTDEVLRALADRTRREILRLVWGQERASGEIAAHFELTRQAVSQHLGVMLECELLSVRQEGTRRIYRANHRPVRELRAEFEMYWDDSLERLRTAAHELEKRNRQRDC
jgi:DNA-binding transcriptional ArsR family regulator